MVHLLRCALGAAAVVALFSPAGLTLTAGPESPAAFGITGCGQITPDATDAVALAPRNHKVVLENDTVRVLEATVPLHSKEPAHTHVWPSVFFEQTSGHDEPWKTVAIRWSEGGPSKGFDSSDRDRHNLLIELKRADCQPSPATNLPATDAVTIHDPNIAVVLENAYVRVLSVRVPPGEKEPWHTHTWPAVVVYFRLPPSQRLLPDGKKTPRAELKDMQVTYDGDSQPLHSIENLGTVTYQAYRVELKPTTATAVARR
jgi:hypothetical protein